MNAREKPRLQGFLLRCFTLRHWRQAPGQTALLILILALGISVFIAMRLANRAVLGSFESFTGLVRQQSDWVITSPAGSLPESTLREVRTLLGDRPVQLLPILEISAAEPRAKDVEPGVVSQRIYTLLGLDLVALTNLTSSDAKEGTRENWLTESRNGAAVMQRIGKDGTGVFVTAALATRLELEPGKSLPIVINDREISLTVVGVIPRLQSGAEPPEATLVLDLPALQKLATRQARIERIECLVEPGSGAARIREEAREILMNAGANGRWNIASQQDRRGTAEQLTGALRLNLTLLSTLALLVGFYFIHQALDGAVVRRREEIATLRSLGVTEREIRFAWLCEAALLGIAGGAIGGLLGWLGAQGAVRLVSRSVHMLYHSSQVERAPFVASEFLFALGLGVGCSIVAGWFPARDAARTPPAQALRRHAGTTLAKLRAWPIIVGALIAIGAAFIPPIRLRAGTSISLGGYIATLASVLTFTAAMAPLLAGIARLLAPVGARSLPLRIALSQLRKPALRHALAAACLLSAVAMTGGMAVLVGSYDVTMRHWLSRTFLSDIYISSEAAQSASSNSRIQPETWRAIVAEPAVEDFYGVQMGPVIVAGRETLLAGAELGFIQRHVDMSWLAKPPSELFDTSRNESLAIVSEAFSRRFNVKPGSVIDVPTPLGMRRFRIVGVFADYGNERGTLMIDRAHYAHWWGDEMLSGMTLKLRAGADPVAMRAKLREQFPALTIYTNATLREQALKVFRDTFAVTYALEIIGVTVAVAGLGLTLASIFMHRRSDLATLRSLAWTPGEIALAAAWEGALLALAGLAAGLVLSLVLGAILVYLVNRQSFGWTLEYHVPWSSMTLLSVLVLASGAATSFFVGRWAAKLPGQREE